MNKMNSIEKVKPPQLDPEKWTQLSMIRPNLDFYNQIFKTVGIL